MDTIVTLPVIAPLIALLRSRKFLTLVSAIIVNVLVARVPELASVRDLLITGVILLALVLIGGISLEDAAKAGKDAATEPVEDLDSQVRELVKELLDTYLKPVPPPASTVNVIVPPTP